MRPVNQKMNFGYLRPYPEDLVIATGLKYHWGQDFLAPEGTPVKAGVNGFWLGCFEHRGYGWLAEVLFSTGRLLWKQWYIARYAHLSPISKQPYDYGQVMAKDAMVGLSGASGALYGGRPRYHLHFELWNAKKVAGAWVRIKLADPSLVTGITQEEV